MHPLHWHTHWLDKTGLTKNVVYIIEVITVLTLNVSVILVGRSQKNYGNGIVCMYNYKNHKKKTDFQKNFEISFYRPVLLPLHKGQPRSIAALFRSVVVLSRFFAVLFRSFSVISRKAPPSF